MSSSASGSGTNEGKLDTYGGGVISALYFVLLRSPPVTRDALVVRLEALFRRISAVYPDGSSRPLKGLDVILHGHAGVERSGYRSSDGDIFQDLIYADDDPAYVEKRALAVVARLKPADRARYDLRIAFLGGANVVEAMKSETKRFYSGYRKDITAFLQHLA